MKISHVVVAALLLAGCKSSLDLNPDGGRKYRCGFETEPCPEGMFCSFEQICRPLGVGQRYACDPTGDAGERIQCTGGWVCGADGFCIDPSGEQLEPVAAPPPTLTAEPLNPTLAWSAPLAVAGNDGFNVTFNSPTITPVAVVHDGGVEAWLYASDGIALSPQRRTTLLASQILQPGIQDVLVHTSRVLVATNTAVHDYRWDIPNERLQLYSSSDAGAKGLSLNGNNDGRVIGWSSNELIFHPHGADEWARYPAPGSPVRMAGYAQTTPNLSAYNFAVFALADVPYAAPLTNQSEWRLADGGAALAPDWRPITVPGFFAGPCDAGVVTGGFRPVALQTNGAFGGLALLELSPVSAPEGSVGSSFIVGSWPATKTCGDEHNTLFDVDAVCAACPAGMSPLDLRISTGLNATARIEALCSRPQNGAVFTTAFEVTPGTEPDGGCSHVPLRVAPIVTPDARVAVNHHAGTYARALATGSNVILSYLSWEEPRPVLLAQRPDVAGIVDIGFGGPSQFAIALPDEQVAGATPLLHVRQPGVGMVRATAQANPAAVVEGRPNWFVLDTGLVVELTPGVQSGRAVVVPNSTIGALNPPVSAQIAPLRDGGEELIVVTFDSILSADISTVIPDIRPSTLEVRLAPQPRVPINSLIVLPPSEAEDVRLRGYALTNGGLSKFTAVNARQWISESVSIPLDEWRELWIDRGRPRLAYASGKTVSLPGRIQLAAGIDGPPFSDFVRACGHVFGLRADGLYRLDQSGGEAGGEWVKVEGTGVEFASPLDEARFFTQRDGLSVFNAFGRGVRVPLPVCPAD